MAWQLTPYLIFPVIAGFIALGIGLFALRRREAPGGWPFAIMCLSSAAWSWGYALEILSPTLTLKLFWDSAQYLPTALLAPSMLVFALLVESTHILTAT